MPFTIQSCRWLLTFSLTILCLPVFANEEAKTIIAEKQFREARSTNNALHKRLISGEDEEQSEVSEQVRQALVELQQRKEEEQKLRDWQEHALNHLLDTLRNSGYTITIGPPKAEDDQPGKVTLAFPVTVKVSDELNKAIHDLSKAYSGDVSAMAEAEVEKVLSSLSLTMSVFLKNRTEYKSRSCHLRFRSLRSYDFKLVFYPQQSFVIQVDIPRQFIDQVTSVKGRIVQNTAVDQ